MKKNIFISALIFTVAFYFAACSNLISDSNTEKPSGIQNGEKAYISISTENETVSRTILPSTIDFSDESISFTIAGFISGGAPAILGSWKCENEKNAYENMTSDSSIVLDIGEWTFRLSVAKDEKEILYQTITKSIVKGKNKLNFTSLVPPDETTSDLFGASVDTLKGSVNVTLNFPYDEIRGVKSVKAALYSVMGESLSDFPFEPLSITHKENSETASINYTKSNIPQGTYRLQIFLYSDEGATEIMNLYTEVVRIVPGAESKGTRTIYSLNTKYTVTYDANGGTFVDGFENEKSYFGSIYPLVESDSISRQYYEFEGWSKTQDNQTVLESTVLTEDITLYAMWTPVLYSIAYDLQGGTLCENDYTSEYTVETESIIFATATKTGFSLQGWAESVDTENTIEPWAKGETGGNKTLYAKWQPIEYEIVYELNGGQFDESVTVSENYTIESEITLSEPVKDGCIFGGWFTAEDFRGNATTGWNSGEKTENITLYAKWNYNIDGAIEKIHNLAENEEITIKVYGELTDEKLTELKTAISASVGIIDLDLSETTGITVWKLSFDTYDGKGTKNLVGLSLPNSVTKFYYNVSFDIQSLPRLKRLAFPNSITEIPGSICRCDFYLETVTMPYTVTKIGESAFKGCSSLKLESLPANVQEIGDYAFYNCSEISIMGIYNNAKIGAYAFAGCDGINTFHNAKVLSLHASEIGDNAFYQCRNLYHINVYDCVKKIGKNAFAETDLAYVYVYGSTRWQYTSNSEYTGGATITLNYSSAPEYLKNTYRGYYLYRE